MNHRIKLLAKVCFLPVTATYAYLLPAMFLLVDIEDYVQKLDEQVNLVRESLLVENHHASE